LLAVFGFPSSPVRCDESAEGEDGVSSVTAGAAFADASLAVREDGGTDATELVSPGSSRSTVISASAATTSSQRSPRTWRSTVGVPAITTRPTQPLPSASASIRTSTESAALASKGWRLNVLERARTCVE
jgi:hypothetical protein